MSISKLVLASLILAAFMAVIASSAQAQQILSGSPGDIITYNGEGPANSDVTLEVSASTTIGVSGGSYSSSLNGVSIPSGSNSFRILVSPVQTMYISGGPSWLGAAMTREGSVSGTTGSYSINNVPAGTYNIRVYGTPASGTSSVTMTVTASGPQHVGPDGRYTASISTSGLPAAVYTVRQSGQEVARVYLGVPAPPTPTPTPTAAATTNVAPTPGGTTIPTESATPQGSPMGSPASASTVPPPTEKISHDITNEKAATESKGLNLAMIAATGVVFLAILGGAYLMLNGKSKR